MPSTTNFGWTTPADTDLVKDGAAAIRTLGNGVDTSFVDLKGGTSGQILAKNSNTDLDFVWVANDQGDITAVTAGTGISGGGTSGAVTITNSMATEITASGDIIVGTGSGTFDNLPIGSTGQVLTADTTVSPYKVKWASAAPSFVGCVLTSSTDQTITNNTDTAVLWESEAIDTDGFHSTITNTNRITIPAGKAGKYLFTSVLSFKTNGTGVRQSYIRKNGTIVYQGFSSPNSSSYTSMHMNTILDLTVGDWVDFAVNQNSGGDLDLEQQGLYSNCSATYLGA